MRFDVFSEVGNEHLLCLWLLHRALRRVSTFGCNLLRAFVTLKIEAAISSGTVVPVYRTAWHYLQSFVLDLCMR